MKPFKYLICDSRYNSEDLADSPPDNYESYITVIPLYTQQERIPQGKVLVDEHVVRFLKGETEIFGVYFGEKTDIEDELWWRKFLPILKPLNN